MSQGTPSASLPNFFLLGAAKAGTTTLHELLRLHPQVWLPFDKEPMFFSRDEQYKRGVDWYVQTYFRRAADFAARGESSPHYLYWAGKVSARLAELYAKRPVKFLLVLRDPTERAYSWYWNMVRDGLEDLPFLQALHAEDARLQEQRDVLEAKGSMQFGYIRGGCYAAQLREYLERFPREAFHIELLEDLKAAPDKVMRRVCAFLEIDDSFSFRPNRANPASMPRSRLAHDTLRGPSTVKSLLKLVLPEALRYRMRVFLTEANLREEAYPDMEPEARQYLGERFATEIQALAKILRRDLSAWSRA